MKGYTLYRYTYLIWFIIIFYNLGKIQIKLDRIIARDWATCRIMQFEDKGNK